jgi:iron(III) transport system substrate-binding protein
MKRTLLSTLIFATFLSVSVNAQTPPAADAVVNVYTNREPGSYSATLETFTKATGIRVNALFAENGLAERIQQEGASSPADVLITVDVARLQEAKDKGITQPLVSTSVNEAIPATFRDKEGHWVGMSYRARVIYTSKERVKDTALTYESLADPKWRGKVCVRSGQHPYNLALISAMIAHKGEAETKKWLEGVKANLARKPSGGDRDVAKDILAGVCDVGLGNTYYVGLMTANPAQKPWADAIKVVLPTFEKGGTHVNISGIALMKHAPNRTNAVKLIEYLATQDAQKVVAEVNYEYPVRLNTPLNPLVESFGKLTPDTLPLTDIAKNRAAASRLVDEVGFDR